MKCGLLGRRLGHSYSPEIHQFLGSYSYCLFEIEPEALQGFLRGKQFDGINVTIPYKKSVIPFCDRLTAVAEKLGAVNTIVRQPDGTLLGHNTDYFGFQSMLNHAGLNPAGKKVLVLGSGGASNTVCAVLQELGADVIVISRYGENNYENLYLHENCAMIVNATPVGMYPNNGYTPLSLDGFPHLEGVLDLIYNPAKTKLILDAESRNIKTENGLWMLIAQAKESAEYFTGSKIPDSLIATIHHQLKIKMENIILVGMPGCGKSTIGKLLSSILGRSFVDSDAYLEHKAGMTIPKILQEHGESGFRKQETDAIAELSRQSGYVIATGGGCVTKQENYPLLHQNGIIIWLKRPLTELSTEGRPLSQATPVEAMYQIRRSMYEAFSDIQIDNTGTPEAVAEKIIQILNLEKIS